MDPFNQPNVTNGSSLPPLEALGPPFQVLLAIIYSMTSISAFFLNILAAIVLFVKKRSSAVLRKHFLNLAFADILMAIFSIPFSYSDFMYGRWIFPLFLCPVSNFISTLAVCLVIYTLIAIGIERYVHSFQKISFHVLLKLETELDLIQARLILRHFMHLSLI